MGFFESIIYMAWRGIAIGLIISAPMGPVGMLCIQRTLDKGRRAGFYTGVGAAISDLFYSLLTGFGLSFIEEFLERNQNIIQLIGSAVLIAFGVYLFRKNPTKSLRRPTTEPASIRKNILGGFLFTVSNPLILFLIIGLFARFNFILRTSDQETAGVQLVPYIFGFVFIFIGALIWWWFITFSIDKVRSHFNIRSMWLINKIIGVIILIFAVVGIITATTALARSEEIRCWNTSRGFGPFASAVPGAENRITNASADTLLLLAPCDGAESVEFRCKVKNHHALEGHPSWGLIAKGADGTTTLIDIRSAETPGDGISSAPALELTARIGGETKERLLFSDNTDIVSRLKEGPSGPDPTGSLNFFKVVVFRDLLTLFGGIHSPERLLQTELPAGFRTDSIGFYIAPGASVSLDELRLTTGRYSQKDAAWSDPELLGEYLRLSHDFMEGYWQPLDRSLDESLLCLGGDYRLAIVRALDGYDLIYLSGARVNADEWSPGMKKAHLSPSGIEGVWDVEWLDAMHRPMSHELKAQMDGNGTLTLQFPYQNSQLRLHHTSGRE